MSKNKKNSENGQGGLKCKIQKNKINEERYKENNFKTLKNNI